ncbi:hypothetical protein EE612_036084, partial [Oryza sativa]
DMYV